MTLFIVGIGLRGIESLSSSTIDLIRTCKNVFLETYTSGTRDDLFSSISHIVGGEISLISREEVEQSSLILDSCNEGDVALLVQGDSLTATTHNQIRLEAMNSGIRVEVIENSSIITTALGLCGLQIYKMGPVVSLPFTTPHFFPRSPYDKIVFNLKFGLHSVVLLDLVNSRFMTPAEALDELGEMDRRFGGEMGIDKRKICLLHAVSTEHQTVLYGESERIRLREFPSGASMIIIPGKIDDNESVFLDRFAEKA